MKMKNETRRILVIVGTRPEAIKLAPLLWLAKTDPAFELEIVSTGQHRQMLAQVFDFFGIKPDWDLDLMKENQSTADILVGAISGVRERVAAFRPHWVVAQGDTTSAAAAGLAAFYEKLPFAHVEAGLRTYDLHSPWPEEFNRRILTLCASLHLAPTMEAQIALWKEGVAPDRIHVTGNTGIDALLRARKKLKESPPFDIVERWGRFVENPFVLCTLHRRENFGEPVREVFRSMRKLIDENGIRFVFPVHRNPMVRQAVAEIFPDQQWNDTAGSLALVDPLNYAEFIFLMDRAHFLLTDSGGVQEEAPCLGKPVLVCRESTERPEAVAAGAAVCVGTSQTRILAEATRLLRDPDWYHRMSRERFLFGDGQASGKILRLLAG